jgi:HopA1 effector protein family
MTLNFQDAPNRMDVSTTHEQRLNTLLINLETLSPTRLKLGGGEAIDLLAIPCLLGPDPRKDVQSLPLSEEAQIVDRLTTLLYFTAYAHIYAGDLVDPHKMNAALQTDQELLSALSHANPTADRWEGGWKVYQLSANGAVHVQKQERARVVQPGQYCFKSGVGLTPGVGNSVELFVARESLIQQQGYYHAFSDTIPCDYDYARVSRLYFSVTYVEAPWLLNKLGTLLNRYFIPYRIKCPVDGSAYDRADGVVLYIARRHVPATLGLLSESLDELQSHLQPGTPLFTRQILDGFAVADDPGTGKSFGQSRCHLVALGLRDAWSGNAEARLEAVKRRFSKAGIDWERPYLAPGLSNVYALPQFTQGQDSVRNSESTMEGRYELVLP